MDHKRRAPEDRKQQLLTTALELAHTTGYNKLTYDTLAEETGVTRPLVHHYFGTMVCFRRTLMSEAIRTRDLVVIAQGLALKDPRALRAPDDLKRAALDSLL